MSGGHDRVFVYTVWASLRGTRFTPQSRRASYAYDYLTTPLRQPVQQSNLCGDDCTSGECGHRYAWCLGGTIWHGALWACLAGILFSFCAIFVRLFYFRFYFAIWCGAKNKATSLRKLHLFQQFGRIFTFSESSCMWTSTKVCVNYVPNFRIWPGKLKTWLYQGEMARKLFQLRACFSLQRQSKPLKLIGFTGLTWQQARPPRTNVNGNAGYYWPALVLNLDYRLALIPIFLLVQ